MPAVDHAVVGDGDDSHGDAVLVADRLDLVLAGGDLRADQDAVQAVINPARYGGDAMGLDIDLFPLLFRSGGDLADQQGSGHATCTEKTNLQHL